MAIYSHFPSSSFALVFLLFSLNIPLYQSFAEPAQFSSVTPPTPQKFEWHSPSAASPSVVSSIVFPPPKLPTMPESEGPPPSPRSSAKPESEGPPPSPRSNAKPESEGPPPSPRSSAKPASLLVPHPRIDTSASSQESFTEVLQSSPGSRRAEASNQPPASSRKLKV